MEGNSTLFKVVTVEQMRAIEAAADAAGFSYEQMMNNAGQAAANRALKIISGIDAPRVTLFIGAGNNGGDGLVTGLHIVQENPDAQVHFYLLKDRNDKYIQAVRAANMLLTLSEHDADKRVLRNLVASSDLVVDALFGIGIRLPIRAEAMHILRQCKRAIHERRSARPDLVTVNPAHTHQIPQAPPLYVLAIDCPSGLDCDTGTIDQNAIAADETITFIAAKRGLFTFPGAAAVGELSIAEIGIPNDVDAYTAVTYYVADSDAMKQMLPPRKLDSHKGRYGKSMIAAGSVNYIGAPALAAEAAYRAGSGLVTVAAPGPVTAALAGQMREATWLMLPHDMGVIAESATKVLAKELHTYDALLIGPGLGTEKTTDDFLRTLLQQSSATQMKPGKRKIGFRIDEAAEKPTDEAEDEMLKLPPLVIDADGLNLLAQTDKWWELLPENTILTPHPGEMARLAHIETSKVQNNRVQLAIEKAKQWQVVLVLKGAHTLISNPQGEVTVLPFKTDALATAGTGDILAGIITGLLSQAMKAYEAAVIGAYVHGLAGQLAGKRYGSRSTIAGDVSQLIGEAFKQISG